MSTEHGKIISRDKKIFFSSLRTVFLELHFPTRRAHFLLISSQWQNRGEWEQGCFIYPKQFIKRTQGIGDSFQQIKVNSAPLCLAPHMQTIPFKGNRGHLDAQWMSSGTACFPLPLPVPQGDLEMLETAWEGEW